MKIVIPTLLCLILSNVAFAESPADYELLDLGIVNSNYEYIDGDKATEFFREQTNALAASLPMKANSYIEVTLAMLLPSYAQVTYRLDLDLNTEEKKEISNTLSSNKYTKKSCIENFLINEYMVANNYTLVYDYQDINNEPLAQIYMNNKICGKYR